MAKKLGYQADPEISKLMVHLRKNKVLKLENTLAYINHHPDQNIRKKLKDVDAFFEKAQEQARRLGYKLEEFWTHDSSYSSQRLSQILYSRNINGLIIGPTTLEHQELDLEWERFSSVTLGYSLLKPDLHRVLSNRYENTLLALRKLKQHGFQRIGCAIEKAHDHLIQDQYACAVATHNLNASPKQQTILFRPAAWNKKNFLKWINDQKPDVILGTSDCISWLEEAGIRIPEEIAFAMELDYEWPIDFTGTHSNLAKLGKVAVNFLVDQINRGETGVPEAPITLFVKGVWHQGKTAPQIGDNR